MIRLLAVGDIALSEEYAALIQKRGPNFPFAQIAEFLKQGNIVLGNLEVPLSDQGQSDCSKPICLRGSPTGTVSLAFAGFTHVSLANNHAYDYGTVALRDTQQRLARAGIATFGIGRNLVDSRRPLILRFPWGFLALLAYNAYNTNGRYYARRNRRGTAPLDLNYIKEDIRALKSRFEPLAILVSLHWGIEGKHYPTPFQRYLAHRIIQEGATIILGHHPHVIQGIETYKNGIIVYSLGNFCFPNIISNHVMGVGYHQRPENKESFIFDCRIAKDRVADYQVIPIYTNQYLQPCLALGELKLSIIKQLCRYSEPLSKINYKEFHDLEIGHKRSHLSRLTTLFKREGIAGIVKRFRLCYFKAFINEFRNYIREAQHRSTVFKKSSAVRNSRQDLAIYY
jgi:hypothetical protein